MRSILFIALVFAAPGLAHADHCGLGRAVLHAVTAPFRAARAVHENRRDAREARRASRGK